jgi:hypothetical protein
MKYIALAFFALCLSGSVIADGHGGNLTFEPRQDSAPMTLTSVHLNKNGGVITAVGDMGVYGRVYTTYTLTADPGGLQGTVLGEGRGAMEDGTFASGSGSGSYFREGTTFTMHILFKISDGTQNLDKIVFDAATGEVTHDAYIVM